MLYGKTNPHGGDIYEKRIAIDFSENTNPFGTPERVKDAVRRAVDSMCHYPDPYARELVKAISEHEEVDSSDLLIGNGAAELIYSYVRAVSPKKVLELGPTFSEYREASENAGAEVDTYILSEDNEFTLTEDFPGYIKGKQYDVIFLCNPNNPTGKLIDKDLLLNILDRAKEDNTRVFLDECFVSLSEDAYTMKDYLDSYPNLFILRAFTKDYALAGVRLGYCMTGDHALLKKMSDTVQGWNVSVLAQAAGLAALKEDEFLENSRTEIFREKEWMKNELEKLGFKVFSSKANYLLFKGDEALSAVLKEKGILVRDCRNYRGLGPGFYRIGIKDRARNTVLLEELERINRIG